MSTAVPSTYTGRVPCARQDVTTYPASSAAVSESPERMAVPRPVRSNRLVLLISRRFCRERADSGVPSEPCNGENPVRNWFWLGTQWLSLALNT